MQAPAAAPEPTEAEVAALLDRLRGVRDTYAALVADADETTTHRQPAPGAWSAVEVIAHIGDLDQFNRTMRYNAILMEDNPTLPAYDPDARNAEGNYTTLSTVDALDFLKAERDAVVMLFEGLRPHEWVRTGVHLRFGQQTLFQFASSLPDHEQMHTAQATAALGGQS